MRGRGQAQQLLAAGHGGVVDGLHVDVVFLQQAVAQRGVQLSVAHLPQGHGKLSSDIGGHLTHVFKTLEDCCCYFCGWMLAQHS